EYGVIFDAIVKRNVEGHNSGNADAILEMYDDSAVVVDKKQGKIFFGVDQIKQMIEGFIKMGKVEFQTSNKTIHDVGVDRFYVTADFESKFVDSGVVMKDLEKIYDAICAKKLKAVAECDVDGCAEIYANHAVIVNKQMDKSAFGMDEIKKLMKSYFESGPYSDFKLPRKEIYGLGSDRFYVNCSYIGTTMKSTLEGE
ncbi:hypothetical protein PENTCL1PPCAC_21401, partial [Pristionchus entomophagus]